MTLPFTPDQFFDVLAEYNRVFWWAAAAFWVAAVVGVAALSRNRVRWSGAVTWMLGVLWLWNAFAYHAAFFTRINPAAWIFAAGFALEGLLLLREASRHEVTYLEASGSLRAAGVGLAGYALAYPFLAMSAHAYPATPTFGLPCPTTILTIGLLLTVRGGPPPPLAVLPAAWGLIGGSAAMLLNVWPDYVLLGAGVGLIAVLATRRLMRAAA